MAIFTGSWILDFGLLTCSLISAIYLYYVQQFKFWKRLNVEHTNPVFPYGDVKGVNYNKSVGEVFTKLYLENKNKPFVGMWMFFRSILLVNDPELVKTILVKEFSSFQDRGFYVNEKDDPLSAHLFAIGGVKWRNLRTKISPAFTSGKMKMMFPTIVECSKELKTLLVEPAEEGGVVDMKEVAARFTTDVISLCAFGIKTNSLRNPDAIFRTMGRKYFEPNLRNALDTILIFFLPKVAELINYVTTPKDISKFFLGAVKETMDYREMNNIKRNDFMQLLIQLKDTGKLEDAEEKEDGGKEVRKITFEEAAAQAFIFFLAGFETSSTTMQFVLYELALNPDIQEKTRKEIQQVLAKYNGEMTYEGVHEMSYLGRVIDETLRKYPPVPILQREAVKNFQMPDTNVVIPKGTQVYIPVCGMHMDPQHFPNPEKFDPDRFAEDEKAKRHHYAYLPFGEGPRNCIGMRFGVMQTRVGLVTLLSNYRFEVCPKTTIPLVYDETSLVTFPKYGMHLKITALNQ